MSDPIRETDVVAERSSKTPATWVDAASRG